MLRGVVEEMADERLEDVSWDAVGRGGGARSWELGDTKLGE